jgi:hypothetical protein
MTSVSGAVNKMEATMGKANWRVAAMASLKKTEVELIEKANAATDKTTERQLCRMVAAVRREKAELAAEMG